MMRSIIFTLFFLMYSLLYSQIQNEGNLRIHDNALVGLFGDFTNNGSFRNNQGTLYVVGTNLQTFEGDSMIQLNDLNLNKASGELDLNTSLSIIDSLTLTYGVINTTTTHPLNFEDNAIVRSASNDAYVNGPVVKYGDDAFTFPLGQNGELHALTIEAPSQTSDAFRAEYHLTDPDLLYPVVSRDATLDDLSSCEFWMLDRIVGSSVVKVSLSWGANACNPADPNQMAVSRWDGSEWRNHGGVASDSTLASITTETVVSNFGPFTFGYIYSSGALPIELIDFRAMNCQERVCLSWETATEINNDYFTIERSGDGVNFSPIATVRGAGTSYSALSYSTADINPLEGVSYYRLKQTDFDGKYEYSEIVAVEREQSSRESLVVFPNPAPPDYFKIRKPNIEGSFTISVMNMQGKVLFQKFFNMNDGEDILITPNNSLLDGYYVVELKTNSAVYTSKLVIKR